MGRSRNNQLIAAVFEAARQPLSPKEVWERAYAKKPGLGIATVYRTIKALVRENYLRIIEFPGGVLRYELRQPNSERDHPPHHFYCRACRNFYPIRGCVARLDELTPPGFRLTDHDLILYGYCDTCQSNPETPPRAADRPDVHTPPPEPPDSHAPRRPSPPHT